MVAQGRVYSPRSGAGRRAPIEARAQSPAQSQRYEELAVSSRTWPSTQKSCVWACLVLLTNFLDPH